MKTRSDSSRSQYLKGVGILLLVAALIAGIAGCTGNGATVPPGTSALHLVYDADLSDVPPGDRASVMEGVKDVIERRINALGIVDHVVAVHEQEDYQWTVAMSLNGVADVEKAKKMLGIFTVVEFRELDDEAEYWIPSTGTVTVNNEEQELVLSSRYFEEDTEVRLDQFGRPVLAFAWDDIGKQLSEQITTRLIDKQLAIFLGDEPLKGEDGRMIAPVVRGVIRDEGVIEGLSIADAQMLSRFLNAGRIGVPLGRWVVKNGSWTFEQGVPLHEE